MRRITLITLVLALVAVGWIPSHDDLNRHRQAMSQIRQALREVQTARVLSGESRRQAVARASWRLNQGIQALAPLAQTPEAQSTLNRLRTALVGLQHPNPPLDQIIALLVQVTSSP